MGIDSIFQQFEGAKDVVITWFSVLTRGPDAFQRIDLESSSVLFYSLQFMLYMAVVDLLFHLPFAAVTGGTRKAVTTESLLLLETYLEYLILGLLLYSTMRLLGGKGSLQASIAAYCLLTAYLPFISVLMMPMRTLIFPSMEQHPDLPTAIQSLPRFSQLSAWEATRFWLSFALTTVVFVIFFLAIFRTFRMLHRLSRARAVVAFLLGLISATAILLLFIEPFLTSIFQQGQVGTTTTSHAAAILCSRARFCCSSTGEACCVFDFRTPTTKVNVRCIQNRCNNALASPLWGEPSLHGLRA